MQVPEPEQNQSAPSQIEQATAFERDPSKRKQIWKFLPAQQKQNEALKFYISESPYQPVLKEYPFKGSEIHRRRLCINLILLSLRAN